MNIQNYAKSFIAVSFILGLSIMYGAWLVTDYVTEAEAAKDTVELAENQMDVAKQEVEKAQAETLRIEGEIERLKGSAR